MTQIRITLIGALLAAGVVACGSAAGGGQADSGDGSSDADVDTDTVPEQDKMPLIENVNPAKAPPGTTTVTILGKRFGPADDPGVVRLSGLSISPVSWSTAAVTFTVPQGAVSGELRVQTGADLVSNAVSFTVDRRGLDGAFWPIGFALNPQDQGLMGSATGVAVEPDGSFLYQMSGWDVVTTHDIREPFDATLSTSSFDDHYHVTSRITFPQRITGLTLFDDYLLCTGDFGLRIYSTASLQQGSPELVAATIDTAFYRADAAFMSDAPNEITVAAAQYRSKSDIFIKLRVYLYQLNTSTGTLAKVAEHLVVDEMATLADPNPALKRLLTVALETTHKRLYVSAKTGVGKGQINAFDLLENAPGNVTVVPVGQQGFAGGGGAIPFWLQAGHGRLWTSIDAGHLPRQKSIHYFEPTVDHPFGPAHAVVSPSLPSYFLVKPHAARFHLIDAETLAIIDGTAGEAFRFDVATLHGCTGDCEVALDSHAVKTPDWPHAVTGYPERGATPGGLYVADEWGGVVPFFFTAHRGLSWPETPSRYHIHTGCWANRLFLFGDRIYVPARGGGPWSVKRSSVSDASDWRRARWRFDLEKPQPYPTSSLVAHRYDGMDDTFIVARAHPKAFGWSYNLHIILYKETDTQFVPLDVSPLIEATSEEGRYRLQSDSIWPEEDLVYVTVWDKGVNAYVVNPIAQSLTPVTQHNELIPDNGNDPVVALQLHGNTAVVGLDRVGQDGGGLRAYSISYENGLPPDRTDPNRTITWSNRQDLFSTAGPDGLGPDIKDLDINQNGVVAVTTSAGLAIFSIEGFDSGLSFSSAKVEINDWKTLGTVPDIGDASFAGLGFDDDLPEYLYVINNGLWCLHLDPQSALTAPKVIAFYPMTQFYNGDHDIGGNGLSGWADPDVDTIHQASDVVAKNKEVFTIGWPGTVQKLTLTQATSP